MISEAEGVDARLAGRGKKTKKKILTLAVQGAPTARLNFNKSPNSGFKAL